MASNINGINAPVLNDQDYVDKISDSFDAVNEHDHTAGKGLPIAAGGIAAGAIDNDDINAAAAIARTKLASGTANRVVVNANGTGVMADAAAITAARALISDANGIPTHSVTTSAELAHVNLVTAPIQAALDSKQLRSVLTTKGDLYVATASDTVARQSIGTNGQVLTADSGQTNGVIWATPSSAPVASDEASNLGVLCSVAASALTIALKQADGSSDASIGNPVKIGFGSSTATSGAFSTRSVTAALSMVVSSGSTLGNASATNHYIYVYALDNAGTVEMAVSSVYYDPGTLVSTTAEGGAGAADSNRIIYSTTARTNVRIRPIARLKSNQTTAGTWAAVPTEVSLLPFDVQKVQCLYSTNAGQSLFTGTEATVLFEDKSVDTHNAYNTSTGVFTAPKAANYFISTCINIVNGTGFDESEIVYIKVRLNGTEAAYAVYEFPASPTAFNDNTTLQASRIFAVAAGDTIDVRGFLDASSSLSTNGGQNHLSICEVSI